MTDDVFAQTAQAARALRGARPLTAEDIEALRAGYAAWSRQWDAFVASAAEGLAEVGRRWQDTIGASFPAAAEARAAAERVALSARRSGGTGPTLPGMDGRRR